MQNTRYPYAENKLQFIFIHKLTLKIKNDPDVSYKIFIENIEKNFCELRERFISHVTKQNTEEEKQKFFGFINTKSFTLHFLG